MLYGVDADIDRTLANRHEHFRRLGEIAHLMLDAGLVLIVSAAELRADDLDIVRVSVAGDRITTVWFGPAEAAEIATDLVIPEGAPLDEACAALSRTAGEARSAAAVMTTSPPRRRAAVRRAPAALVDLAEAAGRAIEAMPSDAPRRAHQGRRQSGGPRRHARPTRSSSRASTRSRPACRSSAKRATGAGRRAGRLDHVVAGRPARRHEGVPGRCPDYTVNIALIRHGRARRRAWCMPRGAAVTYYGAEGLGSCPPARRH